MMTYAIKRVQHTLVFTLLNELSYRTINDMQNFILTVHFLALSLTVTEIEK